MSQNSPLLVLAIGNASQASLAQDNLAQVGQELKLDDTDFLQGDAMQAVLTLNARAFPPEFLLIDIGQRGEEVLADLDLIAEHCDATVQVVVVGAMNDVRFYRELVNRGVLEYLPYPIQPEAVAKALLTAKPALKQSAGAMPGSPPQGSVIACMSAASGDGSSTAAVNLAYVLANECKFPTVLVDMDYQFGLVVRSLDLNAPFGIREVFDHPERGVDQAMIGKMLVGYGSHLKIVSAPASLRLMPEIRPEVVRDLLTLLKSQYRYVVVDVPHVWADWTAAALTCADHRVMVAQLWLRSVTHATRLLGGWRDIGIRKETTSLVINRSGAKFKEAITAKDFERVCGKKIDFLLGNDVKAVTTAENQGKTLLEIGEGPLQQQFRQFAHAFLPSDIAINLPQPQAARPPGKTKLIGFLKGV